MKVIICRRSEADCICPIAIATMPKRHYYQFVALLEMCKQKIDTDMDNERQVKIIEEFFTNDKTVDVYIDRIDKHVYLD